MWFGIQWKILTTYFLPAIAAAKDHMDKKKLFKGSAAHEETRTHDLILRFIRTEGAVWYFKTKFTHRSVPVEAIKSLLEWYI